MTVEAAIRSDEKVEQKPRQIAPDSDKTGIESGGDKRTGNSDLTFVDYRNFAKHKAETEKQPNLPDIAVPVSLNRDVLAEHDKLVKSAGVGMNADSIRQFRSNLDQFERRADAQGLKSEQLSETYKEMGRMLDAPNSPFSPEQRQQLVGQWAKRLADPTSGDVRQGWHDTCGWGYLETRWLSKDPEKISKKLAEVIATGSVTTIDQREEPGASGSNAPLKKLILDSDSLKPDQEAQGLSAHSDRREYVDQLVQVMADNLSWDAKTVSPEGRYVTAGSMQYKQCQEIARPSDSTKGGPADKSCESVVYTNPQSGEQTVMDGSGAGFGGEATIAELGLVNSIVTGRTEPVSFRRPNAGESPDPLNESQIHSAAELRQKLQELKRSGNFPFGALVEVANRGVKEDYLSRHPEKKPSQVPKNSWHFVAVTGVDAKGNVDIYNPWGIKRSLTSDQLYKAMTKPGW